MVQSSTAFIGLDVHKESINVAIADATDARHYGCIGGDAHSVDKLTRRLRSAHRDLVFVYEAGPCGFWLYRRLSGQGLRCMVVSPSMTPRTRGSSVTHNSLVANQRPHISLIDRRHFDDVALPIGMLIGITTSAYVKPKAVARLLTALSHINVSGYRRALLLRASG